MANPRVHTRALDKFTIPDDIIMSQRNIANNTLVEDIKRVAEREQGTRGRYGYSSQTRSVDLSTYVPTYDAACEARSMAAKACMVPFPVEPIFSDQLSMFKPFQMEKDSKLSKAIVESFPDFLRDSCTEVLMIFFKSMSVLFYNIDKYGGADLL